MRRSKYIAVAERLSKRIRSGDYHIHGIPAERDIAVDVGVSHMTARKALRKLLSDGLIYRLPNGRLDIRANGQSARTVQSQIALLAPAFESGETNDWNIALSHLAGKFNFSTRLVYYMHPDDPIIKNTVDSFDCTFMLPPDPDESLVSELRKTGNPFFIINSDWTRLGIPSIMLFPPVFIRKILDHLASLGHRRIDCLNVQPGLTVIPDRIEQWKIWTGEHGFKGKLFNKPVRSFTDPLPAAYSIVDRMIRDGKFNSRALFCTTSPTALGAMSAMMDHGILPGKDVAVCTSDSGGSCEYFKPSLTSMEALDAIPYLELCLKWIQDGGRRWKGSLLIQPENINIVVRQSTVPDIDRKTTPERMLWKEEV
ncbi:MAG TPA: hypothetical protein DET40_22495 [Lentisphaeria bacterium]|nr:MAG: hypothetical protein A2X45_17225 [Lentisphaerae bacterium GWF2_50_93]HCE46325.1 hypothetical protein [Lentisphaeria bacterium]